MKPESVRHWRKKLNTLGDFLLRDEHVRAFGFHIVTRELIAALKAFCKGKVVEVMAGTGYLSACLQQVGVAVEPSDDFSWRKRFCKTHTEVKPVDAVVAVEDADTVIMCWPYMDQTALRVAEAMKSGAILLYCGEGMGGCTASDEFFDLMETWIEVESKELDAANVSFWGIHDNWSVWRKP